jgi:flavin-binding protein dodecin
MEVEDMAVVKIIEIIGNSPISWEAAAANALKTAAQTIRNITALHLKRCTAKVEKNKIVEYRAVVKIAFVVERKEDLAQ